jgi:hypothetical protein
MPRDLLCLDLGRPLGDRQHRVDEPRLHRQTSLP